MSHKPPRGEVARPPVAGTNTAGRDITFHIRDFSREESNFFLYRTVFLYVCFGIPGIERMLDVTIGQLLRPNGNISDEQVKKMIWVVCHFNHFLSQSGNDAVVFINMLIDRYSQVSSVVDNISVPQEIAKSIATLVVRVFVAFQMRINLGDGVAAPAGAQAEAQAEVPGEKLMGQINHELLTDIGQVSESDVLANLNEKVNTEINGAIGRKIGKIKKNNAPPHRQPYSNRLRLLNEAIGIADEARKRKAAEEKAHADDEKRKKIREEQLRLEECIKNFGQSTKFIQAIPVGIYKDFTSIKFDIKKFYVLLPKVLARMISRIKTRLLTTEIKPGPGTAETLNSLGLPDPGIAIKVDEEDDDAQGGGSSIGARRFGITKRKKNNKILRKVNSKNKKNPRKILYGGKGTASVRYLVEHSQPIPQCDHTIDNYHEYVNPTCYICGEPWIEGTQSSMECEHILCVIHGVEYYGLLQSVYLSDDQKNFLSILYAWAHRCCNQRKRNIAFIRKNPNNPPARGNYFVPDDVNIRELLSDIFTLSTYQAGEKNKDGTLKSKFDCSKILRKFKGNKKLFVDKRTSVVTSYVTPLVACVNTVFTGLFEANMVLFNAIGCLKIIAEMSIYFTATGKKAPTLHLDLEKTARFMNEVVFPGCEQGAVSAHGGGGRRIIHDKKTRKSMRRKIQRGGTRGEIIDAISRLLEQEEYETQIGDFKNAVDVFVEDTDKNPNSSRMLSDKLNQMFPGPPSPLEPQLGAVLTSTDPDKIDAILFILFVLNHSRNPTILLGLFLHLKKEARIVREQTDLAQAEPDPLDVPPVDVGDNITQSLMMYQEKRTENTRAFINICIRVFNNEATMASITGFLADCDMMPSFVGVVMFCARQSDFASIKDIILLPIIRQYMVGIDIQRFHENVEPTLKHFHTNIGSILQQLTLYGGLFANSVAAPETPLDHLVNACYHLKQIAQTDPQHYRTWLLHACYLFPSCFDHEDIFSQFGPCDAYGNGVLENPHFQAALGCVASAKTMCARILIKGKSVTPSTHSPDDQTAALELFSNFFDQEDYNILSNLYKPAPAMPTSPRGVEGGLATQYTGIDLQSRIQHAIQTFGINADYDADNFVNIIIGLMWENNMVERGSIPSIDIIRNYILKNIIPKNSKEFAISIASYLNINRDKNQTKIIADYIFNVLLPIISSRLPEQDVKNTLQPDKVKKSTQPPRGDFQQLPPFQSEPVNGPPSQYEVVNRVCGFVEKLVQAKQIPDSPDSQDSRVVMLFNINNEFNHRFRSFELTNEDMVTHLNRVITLLLPQQSTPSSPSSVSDESQEYSPPPQRQPHDIAIEILSTYNYFRDESFDEDDIEYVFNYIMEPDPRINLKYYIKQKKPFKRQRNGGSSSHHTKRQHQQTRCKKPKIKSRRKNRNS